MSSPESDGEEGGEVRLGAALGLDILSNGPSGAGRGWAGQSRSKPVRHPTGSIHGQIRNI